MAANDPDTGFVQRTRYKSTVPHRCTFCAEWNAGVPEYCRWCGERYVAQALRGLPVVREG